MINLSSLSHSQVTNLKAGKISNHDAALLVMHKSGGMVTSKDIKAALKDFRRNPSLHFTYLFNTSQSGGYGFVGKDVNSVSNEVYHYPSVLAGGGCTTQRRTYWYRVKPGTYALTLEGILRLGELQAQLTG